MIRNNVYYELFSSVTVPNPEEVGYWIDLGADAAGNIIKFFDKTINRWVKLTDASSEYATPPYIGNNHNWFIDNRDTGINAVGKNPYIAGYTWWIFDPTLNKYIDTGITAKGLTAYEIAIRNGFVGTEKEWLASLSVASENAAKTALEAAANANAVVEKVNEVLTDIDTAVTDAQQAVKDAQSAVIASEAAVDAAEKATEGATIAIQDAEIATKSASDAALRSNTLSDNPMKIVDNVWYKYNEITKLYESTGIKSIGEPFRIVKKYISVTAMEADFSSIEVTVGQFVMIDTNDIDDPDDAKLYCKSIDGWQFIADLSGTQGIKGDSAYVIAVENGFVGTEAEWIMSLSKDSKDAAKLVTDVISEANKTIEEAVEATTNSVTATNRSNTLSDNLPKIQNGTWWKYNEETKVYEDTGGLANGDVQYATFEVDLTTGELYMNNSETYKGADFVLENGILKAVL